MKKVLLIVTIIVLLTLSLFAQSWNNILSDFSIVDIEEYDNGFWLATESDGAFRYDKNADQWTMYNKDNGIMSQNDNINDMKIIGSKVWFATNYGIYTCNIEGGNWQHKLVPGGYFENWIRAFDFNSSKVYIATFTGLCTSVKNGGAITAHDISDPANYQTSYTNSVFATDSVVWIGTDDGVIKYDCSLPLSDRSSLTYLDKSNAFDTPSDLVMCRSLYANQEGLWLGLDEYTSTNAPNYCQGGLFFYNKQDRLKFAQSTGLPADGIHFIQEYDSTLYCGIYHYVDGVNFDGEGLLKLDLKDTTWTVLDESNWKINSEDIRSYWCNETDTLVGTEDGLYTSISDMSDLRPFDAPQWFTLRSLGNSMVEVRVDSVYLADRYKIIAGNYDHHNVEEFYISKCCDTLEFAQENGLYRIAVRAANEHGAGPYCPDLLSVRTGTELNEILIIKSYEGSEVGSEMGFCFDHTIPMYRSGLGFDAISEEGMFTSGINLQQYKMIDFICGDDNDIFTEENKAFIKSFLEGGGKLFISGSQLIEGVTGSNIDADFYNTYLKAKWKRSDARTYDIRAISTGIFNGIESFSFSNGNDRFDIERPDGFKAVGGAEANLLFADKDSSSYGIAGLQYTGSFGTSSDIGQLLYLGFPLESIENDSLRSAMMLCVLDYFGYDVTLTSTSKNDLPQAFKLFKNYPNPFNPLTVINYQLTTNSSVDLSIYDVNGRKISQLVNSYQTVGYHETTWNAAGQPSGVYVAKLKVNDELKSIKMLLLK